MTFFAFYRMSLIDSKIYWKAIFIKKKQQKKPKKNLVTAQKLYFHLLRIFIP